MAGSDRAGNPWATPGSALIRGTRDPFANGTRRYDAVLGALPSIGRGQGHSAFAPIGGTSLSFSNVSGVPGSVYRPGLKRKGSYAHQETAHDAWEGLAPERDPEEDRPRRYRRPAVPDVIGEGEPYTVADNFARMREIRAKGSVRTEPAEKEPWEALKRYVRDAKLERPAVRPDYFASRDSVEMYVTTFDYVRLPPGEPANDWGRDGAVVRMFGVTAEGHSGAIMVHNFWPYLYSGVPAKLAEEIERDGWEAAKERFASWLDLQAKQRDPKRDAPNNPKRYVRKVELVAGTHRSIYYFQRDPGTYLRIEVQLPRYVPLVRDILSKRHFVPTEKGKREFERLPVGDAARAIGAPEHGEEEEEEEEDPDDEQYDEAALDTENRELWMLPDEETLHALEALRRPENAYGTAPVEVFECDVPFVLRFMVDKDVSGCSWVSVPRDAVQFAAINGKPLEPGRGVDLRSCAQVSLAVDAERLVSLKDRADVPDELRLLSIDIESATSKTRQFPVPSSDPIICLSVNLYKLKDGMNPRARIGFAVGSTTPIERLTHCVNFRADSDWSEETHARWSVEGRRDMLLALRWLMADAWDYDFMMGYNLPFDQSTCNKQADALGIGEAFRRYTRMKDELCQSKVTSFSSKALGTRDTLAFNAAGRISWDILDQVKRDITMKLRSNKLGTVAMEVAGMAKHELPHQQIGPFWMMSPVANDETRAKVLSYNENDEYIAAVVNARKAYIWNAHAAAQTTGVTIEMLMHRGAGIKSVSQLLRAARANRYLMPTYPSAAAKRTAAGFGVAPEGTLLRYEREINEELERIAAAGARTVAERSELEQEAIDRVNERFGIDPLLFSYNDASHFATTAPGREAANFARSMETGTWYAPDEARARSLTKALDAARAKGGRLLLHFVNYVDPAKEPGAGKQKYYGVAQVLSRPEAGALDDCWSGVPPSRTFRVRWLHRFDTSEGRVPFNPDIPWRPALSSPAVPLQQRQARLLLDLCRLRRAVPRVELNLHGKPIEANTIEAYLRRRRRKREAQEEEEEKEVDEGDQAATAAERIDRSIADEFDLPDLDDDEEASDDDDRYEGAVVLETITGLYGVPISTLDFASLYPSIIILHNLCYSTILTRELVRRYELRECDKDPETGQYVDPPNNDYKVMESGHIVLNASVRQGIVPGILIGLLKKRGISKAFMGCAARLKAHFIDRFKKDPLNPDNWRVTDELLLTGNERERCESFVQRIEKLEKETGPILDRATALWAELKARIEGTRYARTVRTARTLRETFRGLSERPEVPGALKQVLSQLAEAVGAFSANVRDRAPLLAAQEAKLLDELPSAVTGEAPEWLGELAAARGLWDGLMEAYDAGAADSFRAETGPMIEALLFEIGVLHQLFDARQNALKIAANSLYGFTGARVGKYPMRAIAEVTTSEGRRSINKKRDLVERMFPLPKRYTYGPTLRDWEENGYVPRHVLEEARGLSSEEFERRLSEVVPVRTKGEAYGRTKEEWRANRERVPAKELARMELEDVEAFGRHLREIEENGMRPIVIGGDTDSIFLCWCHCTKPTEAHELARAAAKFVNSHFRKPQETTYEKTFLPALYNAQKKYAGVVWEPDKPKPKQEPKIGGAPGETQDAIMCKGMENVRRDSTLEVCDAVNTVLRKILVERKLEEAAASVAELIELHRTQRADLSKLLLSKSLSKAPEDYHPRPIHAKVALKVNARNTGESYKVGDRVHFFVVQSDGKGEKTSEMGEDPSYVIENNVALNTEYYLNKLLRPSVRRLMEHIRPGITAFLFDGVPLSNGRLLKTRSVLDGKEVTLSSGKDRPKELKNIKEGRLGSEHEPSNATLRWARKVSEVNDSKIEDAVRAKIESMRRAIGFGHVPWNTPLILSKNWQKLDPALVEAEMPRRGSAALNAAAPPPQASMPPPAPVPAAPKKQVAGVKRTSSLAGLGTARRLCSACGVAPIAEPRAVLCAGCKRADDERAKEIRRAAQAEADRTREEDERVWERCSQCAGNIDNALVCGATDCDNYYIRKNSTRERAKCAAYLKSLQW